jgi:hypothetical protein
MFRKVWPRLVGIDTRGRFVPAVLGAVAASFVWLICVLATATTPDEARDRRAAPDLPIPTAKITSQELRQMTWSGCSLDAKVVQVAAPQVPAGQRSVVTNLAKAGALVRTGTELGAVGSVPLYAVVTHGVFYRDLLPGDSGPDVRAFNRALNKAGLIAGAGSVLETDALAAWRDKVDSTSPMNRVRLATLVAVPPRTSVQAVVVGVGDEVKRGAPLMELGVTAGGYVCEVPDPSGEITPSSVTLQVNGQDVAVESVIVHDRTPQAPGSVELVPAAPASEGSVTLGIEATSTEGVVLTAPLSAVRTGPGGETMVTLVRQGRRRDVEVTLGVSAQGWVEITGHGLEGGFSVELFDPALTPGGEAQSDP